jgi:thiol-disulfide isomerase/thioredoxin
VAVTPQFLAAGPDDVLTHKLAATDATEGWTELREALHPPPVPPAWQVTPPTTEEQAKFFMPFLLALEDKAKDFYTKFPTDAHALDARQQELQIITLALQMGATNQQARLREIASGTAPEELKAQAAGQLKKIDAIGKPLDLQFTAVDGRTVDVTKLKGKVVLIDFWATWCPPCVGELPHVKEAYDKLHAQGFEIVGISLDKDKDKLTAFVGEHKMEWPQFFDGLYWQNKYAVQFGIESIPAMWLVDKKGVLRDINGRADLSNKVTKLLAE